MNTQQEQAKRIEILENELQIKNREIDIEAALEKVRAVAMGMRKQGDLSVISETIFTALRALDFKDLRNTEIIINNDEKETITSYYYSDYGVTGIIELDYKANAIVRGWADDLKQADDAFAQITIPEHEMDAWRLYREEIGYVPDPKLNEATTVYYYSYSIGLGALSISSFRSVSAEQVRTLERFRNVFNLAYQRYTDIAQAEAQAREAQIQLALERVRAQSMMMQHSKELDDTLRVFHEQVLQLGIPSEFSFLWLPNEEKDQHIFWAVWETQKSFGSKAINYPLDRNEPATAQCLVDWKSKPIVAYHVPPEGVESYFAAWSELLDGVEHLKAANFREGLYYVEAFIRYGCFGVLVKNDLDEEEKKVLYRFAIAFEQTYTRFLDLQKAEAQAREAQIEAALERVRARTMAMQKSEELMEAANLLFQQVQSLGIPVWTCGYNIWEIGEKTCTGWMSTLGEIQPSFRIPLTENPSFIHMFESRLKGESYFVEEVSGEALADHYRFMFSLPDFKEIATGQLKDGFTLPASQIHNVFNFKHGNLIFISSEPIPESWDIFKRITAVFEQTYTRFLDLQKAESQARQAKIETALEKVRARALAMQQPEELTEVAQVMRYEMGLLGVEELETSSIYIHHDDSEMAECWYAIKDIRIPEKKLVADHFILNLNDTWVGRQMLAFYQSSEKQVSIPMQGANRKEWINYCSRQSTLLEGFYGEIIPDRTYHLYKFSNGTIGAATPGNISTESWDLLQRAASAFSLAYSRFKDLTQARIDLQSLKEEKQRAETALSELQMTQKQLIQAEKMASLGELTAGIAHEIQNPLNFVNNFSDVNTELIGELKEELATGNLQLATEIADDIQQNEAKINHHGKRADAIVKGMLQHSRSSTGVKEPTDINALADEYLRLAYHGLRAKDKTFNANLKTDFDETIGKINIIPQDMGRVVLNLINNAFYAVNERQKAEGEGFKAVVSVTTKQLNGRIEISVADNGKGIPEKIKDKIFQPFFTTKPTGQGTGLGLSLSYDIVKAHGGELKVMTEEGEGSEFIIQLPVV